MRAIVTLQHCNNCIAHCTECGNLGDGTWPETLYVPLVRVWQSPIAMAEVISLGEGGIRLSKRLKKSCWNHEKCCSWMMKGSRVTRKGWEQPFRLRQLFMRPVQVCCCCCCCCHTKQGTRKNKESSLYHPIQKLKPFKCVVSCLFFFFFSIPYFIQANLKGIGKEAFLLILSQRTSTQYVKYWDAQVKVKTAWRRL